jgi:hypothetical protein
MVGEPSRLGRLRAPRPLLFAHYRSSIDVSDCLIAPCPSARRAAKVGGDGGPCDQAGKPDRLRLLDRHLGGPLARPRSGGGGPGREHGKEDPGRRGRARAIHRVASRDARRREPQRVRIRPRLLEADLGRQHRRYLDFVGGPDAAGGLDLRRRASLPNGAQHTQRMVWLDIEETRFSWAWQRSSDGDATWETLWAIDYTRQHDSKGTT